MVEKSKEDSRIGEIDLSAVDYKRMREELIRILTMSGGGPGVFTDLQKIMIEGLDQARKEAIKNDGQALVNKKLMEMDSLIIETAVKNMQSAQKNMVGVHYQLVKFARDLLVEQKREVDRLNNKGGKIKEPFDLSFLLEIKASTPAIKLVETLDVGLPPAVGLPIDVTPSSRAGRGDYKTVKELKGQGLSIREIAKRTGWSKTRVGQIAKEI